MNPSQQAKLGFQHMKAALVGGHDLTAAFREIGTDMTGQGTRPFVVTGGLGFLLYCTQAIERAGHLPQIPTPDLSAFIHSGHQGRVSACDAMAKAGNLPGLCRLAATMVACIAPLREFLTMQGDLPHMESLNHPQGKTK